MRQFELHRIEDESGVSGTGIVAEGVEFDDGSCALRWKTEHKSTAVYESMRTLEKIHGHNGKTKVVVIGDPFYRGWHDAAQDACENCPFASIGGLERRGNMQAPSYITPKERQLYLDGYRGFARASYGSDWETCSFGWAPAMVLPGGDI
jgi:hypothetical protein